MYMRRQRKHPSGNAPVPGQTAEGDIMVRAVHYRAAQFIYLQFRSLDADIGAFLISALIKNVELMGCFCECSQIFLILVDKKRAYLYYEYTKARL